MLSQKGFKTEKLDSSRRVCLANHEHKIEVQDLIKLKLHICDEYFQNLEIEIEALVIPMKHNIILGLETIRNNDLTFRYPSVFSSKGKRPLKDEMLCQVCEVLEPEGNGKQAIRTLGVTSPSTEPEGKKRVTWSIDSDLPSTPSEPKREHEEEKRNETTSNFSTKQAYDPDDMLERSNAKLEAIPEEMLSSGEGEDILPDIQHLPSPLKEQVQQTLNEFKDLFKTVVSEKGATVTPFSLKVDLKGWRHQKHHTRPRKMSRTSETEFRRQIDLLLKLGVIRHSRAGFYSHGFMVPKPGGKMRLVIDFKSLNLLSDMESGWGIPNIKDILTRLGEQKSGYFCKLDLTAGFHQMLISEESREFTAFKIPWGGLYEWCRLPMGLKGSPAYFQQIMATEVLSGLVMNICEVYLDDVIVHAPTEELLLERVQQVLERFRDRGLTLNPQKCTMFVSEVEYCGHLLDKEGIHFERSKLDSILDFKRPETQQQLRAFLGLANWFRDHVSNHSRLVQPLHGLLKGYSKHQRIKWTPELLQVFEDTKKAVHECPKLFFIDDSLPIYLHTDASQYGMGAYLFQVKDNKEIPIHFLSKSFDDRMSRWSTIQQEGYAIYYAITSWEYLLRDRRFLVRTDHANLKLLHAESDPKVIRWMLTLQSYDFDIEHIAGRDNIVADGFSRMCQDDRSNSNKKSDKTLTSKGGGRGRSRARRPYQSSRRLGLHRLPNRPEDILNADIRIS